MPRVPTYGGPQVQERALQPVLQGPVDVSSGTRALGQTVAHLGDIADRRQRQEAEAEANRIDTEITAGWLEWDSANRPKYRGQNVKGYEAEAAKWWDDARTKYGASASPLARQAVGTALGRKRNQALASVGGYVSAETERHADEQAEAAAQTTIEFGIDTNDTAGAGQRVREIAALKGARKGWTTEQVQAEQQRLLGTMHLAYITRLAEADPVKAQAYFDANRGEIPAVAQGRAEAMLKGEVDNQAAQQFAAGVAGKPLAEQLAAAADISDPQRREKTLQQIRNNHAMVEQARREREGAAADQAWQLVGQGKKVPELVLLQMDGKSRVQLQDYLRDRAKQAATGASVKTDWPTYIDLRERLAAGEKVDLRPYATKLAGPQLEQLLDIQTKAADAKSPKQDSMLTDEQRIGAALVGLGIDKGKSPEEAGRFTAEVDRRVRAESAARGGKDLTADEKQKVIDSVTMDKVYVDEWGRDPEKPLSLLTPDQLGKAYVKSGGRNVPLASVPATDRQQIIQALRAVGRQPTEQAIVDLYLRGKNARASSGTVR
jgi:hypothetical protein